MTADTIAAIATPPGMGGLGVVRISGPRTQELARAILGDLPRPRLALLRTFRDAAGAALDQGIALFFPGPRSFTGEDCLELQGHGGPIVMDLLLTRCLELGARVARPGEFTQRAFLNGKLDLVQAEATADLIAAATATGARLSMRSLQGAFSRRIGSLVEGLTELRTFIEATLDFPDDEIDSRSREWLGTRLTALIEAARATLSEAQQGERIRDGLTVVIAGRPNAGKSSLLNALLQYDAAIVTAVPGTTRDLLRCELQIDGLPVKLIDTAGIHESDEPVEQEGVRRARGQLRLADLILWVYDTRLGLDPDELGTLSTEVPVTLIRNKVDLAQTEAPVSVPHPVIALSALTGYGIDDLRRHLKLRAGIDVLGEGSFVARRRHLEALRHGLSAVQAAESALQQGLGPELVAVELSDAQRALGEITGVVTPDDLLGRIFSTFCIGK